MDIEWGLRVWVDVLERQVKPSVDLSYERPSDISSTSRNLSLARWLRIEVQPSSPALPCEVRSISWSAFVWFLSQLPSVYYDNDPTTCRWQLRTDLDGSRSRLSGDLNSAS